MSPQSPTAMTPSSNGARHPSSSSTNGHPTNGSNGAANGGTVPKRKRRSSQAAAAKIFPLFVLVTMYSLVSTTKSLSSTGTVMEQFDFSLGEFDPSLETEDMDGEAFLTNLNPNRTYTGDCKNRYLYNQTWGKSAARYVDKHLAKDVVRSMNVPDLKIPRTLAYLTDENVTQVFTKEFFQNLSDIGGAVIKPAHTSGGVGQVVDGTYQCFKKCKKEKLRIMPLEPGYHAARQNLMTDLANLYHKAYIETQYQYLDRGILVEERLPIQNMMEYHWWVVRGHPIFVCLRCKSRGQPAGSYYSTRYERLRIKMEGLPQCSSTMAKPKTWDRMVAMVQELGQQIEEVGIVRIDLYASDEDIYFSEFTFTSNGCRFFYDPLVADSLLYAAMYGHLTKAQLTASFIEQSVNSRLWYIVPLLEEPNVRDNITYNALYDTSIITDHPNDWTTCRRAKFYKTSPATDRCMENVNMKVYQKYPIRCVGVTENEFFIVGQWRVPSFGAAMTRVDTKIGVALVIIIFVLWVLELGGEEYKNATTRVKFVMLYLLAVTIYKYLQPGNVGLIAPQSMWRTVQESYQAFVVVHPTDTAPMLGWMHVATYWFQLAAWRARSLRGMLFWYFMYEIVASFLNEYAHIAEEDDRKVRCLRVTFIYASRQYAVNDVVRAYLTPPFFVYLYLLPQLILQWLPGSTAEAATELVVQQ